MATQFPIEQETNALEEQQDMPEGMTENEDGSVEVDMELDDSEIEELPDGSAIVTMAEKTRGPQEDEDFYENLAENDEIDPFDLDRIAMQYIDYIEKDKEARSLRDKQYEEGIKRTGMGNDAPGGANFMGASKVVHPVMAEACVDFASRAIKELFPPERPNPHQDSWRPRQVQARDRRAQTRLHELAVDRADRRVPRRTRADAHPTPIRWLSIHEDVVRRRQEAPLR